MKLAISPSAFINLSISIITLWIILLLSTTSVSAFSVVGGFKGSANGAITAMAKQASGAVIVAGDFTQLGGINRNRLARLRNDGQVDASFAATAVGAGTIRDMVIQADGKVIIVGDFLSVGGVSRTRIARLMIDGSLDTGFDTSASLGPNGSINSIALQKDGRIVIVGAFSSVSGQLRGRMARLNVDGSLDSVLTGGFNGNVLSVAVAEDGRIAAVGSFTNYKGQAANGIAVFNGDGETEELFDAGSGFTSPYPAKVLFERDGSLLVGGAFNSYRGDTNQQRLIRIGRDGAIDSSYTANSGIDGNVFSMTLLDDGRLAVTGSYSQISNTARTRAAILLPDGAADTTFVPSNSGFSSSPAYSRILQQDDGHILLGGLFTSNVVGTNLTRLTESGIFDAAATPAFNNRVNSLSQQADGKVILTGNFLTGGATPARRVARLNQDGSLDTSFQPVTFSATANLIASAVQVDGKILVGGSFLISASVSSKQGVARLLADGSLDTSFNNSGVLPGQQVRAIAVLPDGKIILGGLFNSMNGVSAGNLVKLLNDGSIDTEFVSQNFDGRVDAVHVQPDGKILVGGDFSNHNGAVARRIIRLMPDGSRDNTFVSSANANVTGIATLASGKILISGTFTIVDSSTAWRVARLSSQGALDTSYTASANNDVFSMAVTENGNTLLGGDFSALGTELTSRIGRLREDGSASTEFSTGTQFFTDSIITTVAVRGDGVSIVGGAFANIGGQSRARYARISHDDDPVGNRLRFDPSARTLEFSRVGSAPLLNWLTLEISSDGLSWSPPVPATRPVNQPWSFSGINLDDGEYNYLRFRGNFGSSRSSSGSIFEQTYQVYQGGETSACDFFVVKNKLNAVSVICL